LICFNFDVSLCSRKPVLNGISFKVPAGETYALVGTSGAGKSSIDGQNIAMVRLLIYMCQCEYANTSSLSYYWNVI